MTTPRSENPDVNTVKKYFPQHLISQYFRNRNKINKYYKPPSSNQQIRPFLYNFYEYYKLSNYLVSISNNDPDSIHQLLTNYSSDSDLFSKLQLKKSSEDDYDAHLACYLIKKLKKSPKTFCNAGKKSEFAKCLAKKLNLKISDSGTVDLVACNMYLHQNMNKLKDVAQKVKKGGLFILKEFDVVDDYDAMFADIICKTSGNEYYNAMEWMAIMKKYGFKLLTGIYYHNSVKFQCEPVSIIFHIYIKQV